MGRGIRTIVALLALLGPPPLWAQDQATLDRAEELAVEGFNLYKEGEYQKALSRAQQAFTLVPKATYLYNMALCHTKLEQYREALKALKRYLELEPLADNRENVQRRIRNLTERIGPALGEVEVLSTPPQARVLVQGKEMGQTPCLLKVPSGFLSVQVSKEGYAPLTREITVEEGVRTQLALDLESLGLPPREGSNWMPSVASWILMGAGAATLIGGAVVGGLASSDMSQAQQAWDRANTPEGYRSAEEQGSTAQDKALATNVILASGGALLISGLLVWLLSPHEREEAALSWSTSPAGVAVGGRFP